VLVSLQRKDQAQAVRGQQDEGYLQAQPDLVQDRLASMAEKVKGYSEE
jgi:hypothetical protein